MAEDCGAGCSDIKASFGDCIDEILGIRDCIGAALAPVSIVTRTWSGTRPGDGTLTDVTVLLTPTPMIKDYSHDIRLQQGGAYKQGDLILKGVSKNSYPLERTLRTDTGIKNVEKFIKVGSNFYRTINIKENLVTWDIQVRKVAQDETQSKGA